MTPLSRPVARKSSGMHRGRQLVVTLYPGDVIGVRHLRTRREYHLSLAAVYDMAVKATVLRERAQREKRKQRGAK